MALESLEEGEKMGLKSQFYSLRWCFANFGLEVLVNGEPNKNFNELRTNDCFIRTQVVVGSLSSVDCDQLQINI